jgi:hypothetical protein
LSRRSPTISCARAAAPPPRAQAITAAEAIARRLDDPALLALALNCRFMRLAITGRTAEAEVAYRSAAGRRTAKRSAPVCR